jgi:Protein of unknown function (DUF4058)
MKSPFPGMDPYLEGYLWPDVHHELAAAIKAQLAPKIAPKYVARLELYTVNDTSPETEIGILYPDVELFRKENVVREPAAVYGEITEAPPTEPTVIIPGNRAVGVTIPIVEIRDTSQNRLVTAIEILSPVNKRKPGLETYREKRADLHRSGVHLLEIDLLRRGTRPFAHPHLPQSDYLTLLMRADTQNTEVWAFNVPDLLPVLPVPLAHPDPDVSLNLREALDTIYERSLYHLSIDYKKDPPPPELKTATKAWVEQLPEQ